MKIQEFAVTVSKERVCHLIDADPSSELYEEILEELEQMLPIAYEKIQPCAVLEFGDFKDYTSFVKESSTEALYEIHSIGSGMSEWSTSLFQEGNYLGGMLADAIADDYLFQMDSEIQKIVVQMCREKKRGIARRLEAPQDVPMDIQKKAFDVTNAEKEMGLKIKESYMLDPVKSVCQVYLLDSDHTRFCVEHDCTRCQNYKCKLRKESSVCVKVKTEEKEYKIYGSTKQTLYELLLKHGIAIPAVCSGKGLCGKCRIQVLEGEICLSEEDKRYFTKEEIEKGFRLSCQAYPGTDCTIELSQNHSGKFFVLANEDEEKIVAATPGGEYGIAVDIGTTTVAMMLVEIKTGAVIDVFTAINPQNVYGADVISRMEASNTGKKEALKEKIRGILREGVTALLDNKKVSVARMVIGANTTMVHLLMGYSCETLGVAPFKPVTLDTIYTTCGKMFGDIGTNDFEIILYPGISAYVGGDITAGLYALDFDKRDGIAVLMDLGTNGEMAIGNKDRIMVTSTAMGPAFEGGNIVCGMGSVEGAISSVKLNKDQVLVETIGKKPPKGICGTGVIDVVYEMLREEIMDETGHMDSPYFEDGIVLSEEAGIRFYQKDVRAIQLAKAAVRAGFETLVSKFGVSYEDIEEIYVAGGFGYKMDIQKAVGIGLFPEACAQKIKAVGNTCLKGAVKYLCRENADEVTRQLVKQAEEVPLANDKTFFESYMDSMYFTQE